MILVLCMKCGAVLNEDSKRCSCRRARLRATETKAARQPAGALSRLAQVALTAAALEPQTEDEMRSALAMAARASREGTN